MENLGRGILSLLVVLLLMLSGLPLLRFIPIASAQTPTFPAGIREYVPITITNSQSSPTPTPFQQMVVVNSATYSTYEASNLQNVEFLDASGNVIPSWLESGNNDAATSTVYWLKIVNGIQAGQSVTVYLVFASLGTSLFNSQMVGEAPQMPSTYGQYDDGVNVFGFYDNFAGTTLSSKWVDESQASGYPLTVNNGIVVGPETRANNLPAIYSGNTFGQGVIDFFGVIPAGGAWGSGTVASMGLGSPSNAYGDGSNMVQIGDFNSAYGLATGSWGNVVAGLSFGRAYVYSIIIPLSIPSSISAQIDYSGTITSYAGMPSLPQPIVIGNQHSTGITLGPIQWIRTRAFPPNDVMPSASIGTLASTETISVTCLSSPVVLGSSTVCITTVTGDMPTGTVTWISSGTGTFSPTSCTLSFGSCQVAYAPSTSVVPVTITANYGGDAHNQPVSGTFPLSVSPALTSTSVSCFPSPVSAGSPTTCTATVAGSYSPSGIATWASSGVASFSPTSSCTLSAQSCAVSYTATSPASPITITATYTGDQNNAGSSGTFSLAVAPRSPTPSTTSVACSPSPTPVGTSTSCTATVTGFSPTGTVTWTSGGYGTFHPSSCALASGQCVVSFAPSSVTTVNVTATYGGDSNNVGSSGKAALVVTKASSNTSVTCLPSPVTVGSSTSCVATVEGDSPSGTVVFTSSSSTGSFSPSDGDCFISSGSCSVTYFDTEAGTSQITATYQGDANNGESAGTFPLTVSKSPTTVVVACSPSPATVSSFSTCVAAVTGYSPGGTVTFTSSSSSGAFDPSNGRCTLSSGSCSVRFSDATSGSPVVTASYAGDSNNLGGAGTSSLVVNGSQDLTLYLAVAIVVVIAVGLAGFMLLRRKKSG